MSFSGEHRYCNQLSYLVRSVISVGEEGLDFPACDLVIRFDPLQTMIGYVQSRGRARHQKSKLILMLNQDQPVEIENYKVNSLGS